MQAFAQTTVNDQMTEWFYVHETNNMRVQKQFIVFSYYKTLWSTSRVRLSSWLNFTHSAPLIHHQLAWINLATTLNPGPEVGKLFPWRAREYSELWANCALSQLLNFAIVAHKQPWQYRDKWTALGSNKTSSAETGGQLNLAHRRQFSFLPTPVPVCCSESPPWGSWKAFKIAQDWWTTVNYCRAATPVQNEQLKWTVKRTKLVNTMTTKQENLHSPFSSLLSLPFCGSYHNRKNRYMFDCFKCYAF